MNISYRFKGVVEVLLKQPDMGGSKSKELPPAPSPLLQENHCKTLDWGTKDEMKEHLRRFQISIPDVKNLRILVYGPIGAGKSSFINSIDSIFQGRLTTGALADTLAGHSFTKMYKTHKIKDGQYGVYLNFVISDVMGLERGDSEGVQTDDIKNILAGRIKEGYVFNPANPCLEKEYNKDPSLSDKIHCLVSVIPADTLLWCADSSKISDHAMRETDKAFIKKIKDVRAHASMMGIPQVVILSKVDEACPEVNEDIKMIYNSRKIYERIKHCSFNLGVPEYCIFPVKNYHDENCLNNDMDVLLLSALTNILNFANDHVAEMKEKEG
ncbi:interferon-induced protein 44-like [Alosa pseudoharengus]|uniref:interferon-induced protein 44-like n=1 Tax=Alosa pseudoharengus TaxID=34774 RepID=UPI003F8ADDC7